MLCRPLVLQFMHYYVTVTDTVRSELSTMLLINSYYIMGASLNTMLICGIFRAGGDVRFGLVCDIIAMWGYAVPVGLLCAFVLRIPEMWVYFVLCLDEFVKPAVVFAHYRKRGGCGTSPGTRYREQRLERKDEGEARASLFAMLQLRA